MKKKFDQETQQYFDTLPFYVQDAVYMSSVEVLNKKDLEKIAENITKQNDRQI